MTILMMVILYYYVYYLLLSLLLGHGPGPHEGARRLPRAALPGRRRHPAGGDENKYMTISEYMTIHI